MSTLAASDAMKQKGKIFSQHQAALTLLNNILDNPKSRDINWLDVACGKGQIILQLKKNLSEKARLKINYYAFDIKDDFIILAEKEAESLKINSFNKNVADISSFDKYYESERFDYITLINAFHEFHPKVIPMILFESILRLKKDGIMYVYDMEMLNPNELGAINWKKGEIQIILTKFFNLIGKNKYMPEVAQWFHKSTVGWNFTIQKSLIESKNETLLIRKKEILEETKKEIIMIIKTKLDNSKKALESLTKYGSSTPGENEDIINNLYEFWSLIHALEVNE